MPLPPDVQTKFLRALRSPRFFTAILVIFGLESLWLALSAAYPGVFDENVHFGIIKLYSHQWSPFFPANLTDTDPSGAVVRDPSYLYHYLMSFPYRLISAATASQTAQVIVLRLINIMLFGSSLVLFRRLLLRTKTSPAIVHTVLLFLILVPMVPLLASEINYDNLILPLTGLVLLMTVSLSDSLGRRRLPADGILWLLTLCLLSSLVQFEFLPVFAAVFLWLGWRLWRSGLGRRQIRQSLFRGWRITSWRRKLLIGLPLVLATGLFLQMYGVNAVRYHNFTPACNQVLTDRQCASDGAWVRAQQALAHKTTVDINPLRFSAGWAYRLMVGMFYTSSGGGSPQAFYLSVNPLPVIFGAALVFLVLGMVLAIRYWRTITGSYKHLDFLIFVSLLYAAALWLRNYHDYVRLGQKVAINGRYLLPIALPVMLVLALGFNRWLRRRPRLKLGLLAAALLLFSQGGGALTYFVYSQPDWYWQSPAVIRFNNDAQAVIKPLVIIKSPVPSVSGL